MGAAGTLFGQHLNHKRTLERDRLVAEQEARARHRTEWLTIQRETFMSLQHSLEVIVNVRGMPNGQRLTDDAREEGFKASFQVHALAARLEDRQLATQIRAWLDTGFDDGDVMRGALHPIQEKLGEQFRALYSA